MLINSSYAVVVEVKNTLKKDDIDKHLKRLKKIQKAPGRLLKGLTLYGAVAGMIINNDIINYALNQGLYVLKPNGSNIEIAEMSRFKPILLKTSDVN